MELYEQIKDAGIVSRKCGFSRPTLRKWLRHYKYQGVDGLKEQTRKPLKSSKKVTIEQEEIILSLQNDRKLGVRRIQSEIKRLHDIALSLATIHKFSKEIIYPIYRRKGIIVSRQKDISASFPAKEYRWMQNS